MPNRRVHNASFWTRCKQLNYRVHAKPLRRKITNIVCPTGVCFFLLKRKKHTPVLQTMLVILRRRSINRSALSTSISIIGVRLADPAPASGRVGTRTLRLALGWLLRQQLRQLRRRRRRRRRPRPSLPARHLAVAPPSAARSTLPPKAGH